MYNIFCIYVGSTSNIGGIIGGVVGGLSVLIILTMLTILLMAVALRLLKRKGIDY